jgi:uncharacterized membrane protein YfcA
MKNALAILTTAIVAAFLQWFLPWWLIVIPCSVMGFFIGEKKGSPAFLRGFFAIFLLWISYAFILSFQNDHLLANRMSLLILKIKSPLLLLIVSAFIGGLVGGLSAITGFFIRRKL